MDSTSHTVSPGTPVTLVLNPGIVPCADAVDMLAALAARSVTDKSPRGESSQEAGTVRWNYWNASEICIANIQRMDFIDGIQYAYSNHLGVEFTPDDLLRCLSVATSSFLQDRNNAIEFGPRLGLYATAGKTNLCVDFPNSYADFINRLVAQVTKRVESSPGASKLIVAMSTTFSTSTPADQLVAKVSILATMSQFFSYCMTCCGFPWVRIKGDQADWQACIDAANAVADVFGADCELSMWITSNFVPIVLARMLKTVQVLANPESKEYETEIFGLRDMWRRFISVAQNGSGGTSWTGWWVHMFFAETLKWSDEPDLERKLYPSDVQSSVMGVEYTVVGQAETQTLLCGSFGIAEANSEGGIPGVRFVAGVGETLAIGGKRILGRMSSYRPDDFDVAKPLRIVQFYERAGSQDNQFLANPEMYTLDEDTKAFKDEYIRLEATFQKACDDFGQDWLAALESQGILNSQKLAHLSGLQHDLFEKFLREVDSIRTRSLWTDLQQLMNTITVPDESNVLWIISGLLSIGGIGVDDSILMDFVPLLTGVITLTWDSLRNVFDAGEVLEKYEMAAKKTRKCVERLTNAHVLSIEHKLDSLTDVQRDFVNRLRADPMRWIRYSQALPELAEDLSRIQSYALLDSLWAEDPAVRVETICSVREQERIHRNCRIPHFDLRLLARKDRDLLALPGAMEALYSRLPTKEAHEATITEWLTRSVFVDSFCYHCKTQVESFLKDPDAVVDECVRVYTEKSAQPWVSCFAQNMKRPLFKSTFVSKVRSVVEKEYQLWNHPVEPLNLHK